MRFDFKAVVFIRANPGKKETTDGSGSHVNFIQKQCTSPEVVSPEKWYVVLLSSDQLVMTISSSTVTDVSRNRDSVEIA